MEENLILNLKKVLCRVHAGTIGKQKQSSAIRPHWTVVDIMLGFTNWQELSRHQWNQSAICYLPILRHVKCCSPDFAIDDYPDTNVTYKPLNCPPIIDDISNIIYNPVYGISEESCQPSVS
jgi:hypothetical protein